MGTEEGRRFIYESLKKLDVLLKWQMPKGWSGTVTTYLHELMPMIKGPLRAGDKFQNANGTVFVVSELEHGQCPVFGKADRDVLPYRITVASAAGPRRAALALVHELLHAADYQTGRVTDHTLLHNIAAIIESEVLQKMKGYYASSP